MKPPSTYLILVKKMASRQYLIGQVNALKARRRLAREPLPLAGAW
jgi:hypothetical protein